MNMYEDFVRYCEDKRCEFPCEEEKFYFRAMVFVDDINFCPSDYDCDDKLSAHLFLMREGQKRHDFIWASNIW